MKVEQLWLCEPETPPSPDAKRMDVPRAPSCMYALHRLLRAKIVNMLEQTQSSNTLT